MPGDSTQQTGLADKRYPWIDTLRGIAILMVIAVHASHGLKGSESLLKTIFGFGGYGVQLFFVASAMTLCMSLENNYGKPRWLMKYAIRRYFRIAPMYYVGIVLYFFWSFAKNQVQHGLIGPLPQYTVANVLANIFFIHGFFPAAYNDIVPGGWSIGTEVAFYVAFPVLFLLYRTARQPMLLSGLLLAACYALISLVQWQMGQSTASSAFLYFNIANQLHVFIIGICGFYFLSALAGLPFPLLMLLILLWGLAGYSVGLSQIPNTPFLVLAAYAMAFVGLAALMARLRLNMAWLGEIGRRSFSMYVIHFLFMNVIDYSFNHGSGVLTGYPNLKALVHFGAAVLATYWIAGLTKRLIEDPCIQFGARLTKLRSTPQ
ncbi:MAG: acyltransferase [Rugosibacter sp.]|nr:acyltransferase [Rugosibacter sp.]